MRELGDLRLAPPPSPRPRIAWSKLRAAAAVSAAVLGLLLLLHHFLGEYLGGALVALHKQLERQFAEHPAVVLTVFQLLFIAAHFLLVPVHSLLCIALTVIMRQFWLALAASLAFSLVSSSLLYVVVQRLIHQRIWNRYRNNELLNLLLEESARHPFRVALMARMLAVPVGLKDYILAVIHSPFPAYLGSALLSNLVFLTSAASIGISLENLEELLEEKKPWARKSFAEKLSVALFLAVFGFTSLAVFLISVWTSRQLKSRRTQKEVELGSRPVSPERSA